MTKTGIMFTKKNLFYLAIISLCSLILTLDLFIHQGEAATFDSQIHITNITQFQKALTDGDFPVTWADGFANYGLPTPIVSQQLTSYLGALISFITSSPVLSYEILIFIGALFSSLTVFQFLKIYSKSESALVATIFFNFTAYRIFNLYVRGALPEFFAIGFIPLILIGIHQIYSHRRQGFYLAFISTTLLILAHPFMFVVSLFLSVPYVAMLHFSKPEKNFKTFMLFLLANIAALLFDMWYVLPLISEIKYFVISRNITQLVPDQFLSLSNYFSNAWPYFYHNDIFVRGNLVNFGLLESLVLGSGLLYLWIKPPEKHLHLVWFLTGISAFLIFMTTSFSWPIYQYLPMLANIQFPWRMLSVLMFIPPIVIALVLDQLPFSKTLGLLLISIVVILRFPQIYGKNFTIYSPQHYSKTIKNLHFDSLNTMWTGNTLDYPVKSFKGEIIEGQGIILERLEKNSWRTYSVQADSDLRMVDYTFYFPGWAVYIDGQPSDIEFQDPNYRGVITYKVPSGKHTIEVVFENTRVRLVARIISLISLLSCLVYATIELKKRKQKK